MWFCNHLALITSLCLQCDREKNSNKAWNKVQSYVTQNVNPFTHATSFRVINEVYATVVFILYDGLRDLAKCVWRQTNALAYGIMGNVVRFLNFMIKTKTVLIILKK